jgi:hypothetical protein
MISRLQSRSSGSAISEGRRRRCRLWRRHVLLRCHDYPVPPFSGGTEVAVTAASWPAPAGGCARAYRRISALPAVTRVLPCCRVILPDQGSHVSAAAFRFTVRRTTSVPVRSRTRRHARPACRHADPDGRAPRSRENHPGRRTRRSAPGAAADPGSLDDPAVRGSDGRRQALGARRPAHLGRPAGAPAGDQRRARLRALGPR